MGYYFNDLIRLIYDTASLWILLELLFVTSCVSTTILFLNKNEYFSLLSAAPIIYFLSHSLFYESHLMIVLLAMSVQAIIINLIQKNQNKNLKSSDSPVRLNC